MEKEITAFVLKDLKTKNFTIYSEDSRCNAIISDKNLKKAKQNFKEATLLGYAVANLLNFEEAVKRNFDPKWLLPSEIKYLKTKKIAY